MEDQIFTDETLYRTVQELATQDAAVLIERDKSYGSSWKKRGGIGAFMMLARKWDRIENILRHLTPATWDVFAAIEMDPNDNGIIDDIRDLRRYLLLVEAEMTCRGVFRSRQATEADMRNSAINAYQNQGIGRARANDIRFGDNSIYHGNAEKKI
jgi:hypothetical protein